MALGRRVATCGIALLALAWTLPCAAEGASLDDATKEQTSAAQKAFEAADVLYDSKHYAEALSAYRTSHGVVRSPNARLMIARSLRELGRLGEAYAEAKLAAAEAEAVAQRHPRYAETARAAREDLAALEPRVGFVKPVLGSKARAGVSVRIGERSFDAMVLDEPVPVTPGTVTVTASVPDEKELRRSVTVAAGSTQTVTFDGDSGGSLDSGAVSDAHLAEEPAPPAEAAVAVGPDSSLRTWSYVAGGAGAAGLVTFAVFGALNNSRYSELDSQCPNGACPPGRNDDIDAGRRYQLIANVGLGVGIVGLGAGVTLFVLSANQGSAGDERRTALRVTPASVSLEGRF